MASRPETPGPAGVGVAATFAQRYRRLAMLALLLVSLGDILTTSVGLRLGIPEGNPAMAAILAQHGELWMYGTKLALMGLVLGLCQRISPRYPLAWYAVFFWALITGLVVYSNWVQVVARLGPL